MEDASLQITHNAPVNKRMTSPAIPSCPVLNVQVALTKAPGHTPYL